MATEIKIKNLPEGYQSFITNGKHSIIGDETPNAKGTDLGLNPSELVLAGLAMCKVTTIRYAARRNGWDIGNVEAKLVQQVKREAQSFVTNVKIQVDIEGNVTGEQKAALLKQADNCYIHRLLKGEWEIETARLPAAELKDSE